MQRLLITLLVTYILKQRNSLKLQFSIFATVFTVSPWTERLIWYFSVAYKVIMQAKSLSIHIAPMEEESRLTTLRARLLTSLSDGLNIFSANDVCIFILWIGRVMIAITDALHGWWLINGYWSWLGYITWLMGLYSHDRRMIRIVFTTAIRYPMLQRPMDVTNWSSLWVSWVARQGMDPWIWAYVGVVTGYWK